MKKAILFFSMIFLSVLFASHTASQTVPLAQGKPIEHYLKFLKNHVQNPVDYVIGLFEKADIVILCERAHPEITQYELITEILKDMRFIKKCGYVFTEIGRSDVQPCVENFLMNDRLPDEQANESLLQIIRNLQHSPLWECTNYYDLLHDVYEINKTLPVKEKIHIYPSNMPFSWKEMTKEKYAEFNKKKPRIRDKIIAEQIIEKYKEILNSGSERKKALVIMNYRHAFPHLDVVSGTQKRHINNVGGFLMKEFPGKTANVMLNSIRILDATDTEMSWTALQDGKWDAAFALAGNPDTGFDFKGSPFGSDPFDYFPYQHDYTYDDIFTGFVFYKPLEKHVMRYGIPAIFDEAFREEFTRRQWIKNEKTTKEDINEMVEALGKIHEFSYDNKEKMGESDYKALIQKWLK